MIQILKGIIFGSAEKQEAKQNGFSENVQPQVATIPHQDANHQREMLRRKAQILKKSVS